MGYIGIDIGTTNIKAALFSETGEIMQYESIVTPIVHPKKEWSEFEPYKIWECVSECLRRITDNRKEEDIVSVGISSLGESGIFVDKNGIPLSNMIAWYDPRTKAQIDYLKEKICDERIYAITGQIPSDKYGICKLLWLKDNQKEAYEKAEHWLSMEDWILFCLTGKFATDYSIASRTMVFDIHQLCWSEEILNAIDVKKELFSEAFPGGTFIGTITESARKATGLGINVKVSCGGHDHACAAIAVNIFEDGIVLNSMGTAEVSMIAVEKPVLNLESFQRYYSFYPHCGEKNYRLITSNQSCGACIEWFIKNFLSECSEKEKQSGKSKYDYFLDAADQTTEKNKKLFFIPFLRGSVEDRNLRGIFWGIDDSHEIGDFVRAIIDGICYELKKQIGGYEEIFQDKFSTIRVVGGLSKSGRIMKRKSEIQQDRIEIPKCTEAACFGAALLGAVGAEKIRFSDLQKFNKLNYYLDPAQNEAEKKEYEKYILIRERIKKIYEEIGKGE